MYSEQISGEGETKMDNQSRERYPGEEHSYHSEKIQLIKPFWRRYLWPIIAAVALVFVIIFASTTLVLLIRSSQSSPNNALPPQVSTPLQTQISSTAMPTTSTPNTTPTVVPTITTTPTSQTTSGLPCIVNISTWTGGSPDWVVHN